MAQDAVAVTGYANLDFASGLSGAAEGRTFEIDKLHIDIDADLEALAGWRGWTAHLSLLNTSGDLANTRFGTLQGFDNIEAPNRRARVYEAFIERAFPQGSLRAGLYDLNSEFYVTEAAGLLIGPAFGIGSELAATGVAGPSIFPSTALGARLKLEGRGRYGQIVLLNARAGAPGDPGGIDTDFGDGVLTVAEAGWKGAGHWAVGVWGYSQPGDDLFVRRPDGSPVRRRPAGAYLVAEHPLRIDMRGPQASLFARAGVSDGRTGPFRGGWQAGVVVERLIQARPEARLSAGLSSGLLGDSYRAASSAAGVPLSGRELQIEVTYADRLTPWLTVQPDLQVIIDPGGDPSAEALVILTFRLTAEF